MCLDRGGAVATASITEQRRPGPPGPRTLVSISTRMREQCAPIFQFNEFDQDTPSSMKMQLLRATTRQRKKVLKASPFSREARPFWPPPRLSDARSRPCWHFPDFQAPVILDTSPRNRPGQGSTRSAHPYYRLGPNSCANQGCPASLWLPRPRVSGACPAEGVKRMFSAPPQALGH